MDEDGLVYRMRPESSGEWSSTASGVKFDADVEYSTSSGPTAFGPMKASDFAG